MSVMTTPHKPERLKYKSSLVIFFLYNEVIHSRAALGTQNIFFTFHSLLCTLNFKKIKIKSKKFKSFLLPHNRNRPLFGTIIRQTSSKHSLFNSPDIYISAYMDTI